MTPPVVEMEGVHLELGGQVILEDVNLRVEPGDFVGILGPNGGGKTMLLKVMLGLLKPDRGTVRLFGAPPQKSRSRVGYVPQFARFDCDYPVDVLNMVLMGRLRGLLRPFTAEDRKVALRSLERLGIGDLAGRQIGRLSLGQRQRALVARALAVEPELLILDEPTASLDPGGGQGVYQILEDLSRDMTVLLVSHDLGVLASHVRSVACVNRRLFFHHASEITREMVENSYGCPVDFVMHRHTHRLLEGH